MATVPAGSTDEASAAVMAALAAFESGLALPVEIYAAFLDRLAAGIKARSDKLALAIACDVGMPLKIARAIQLGTILGIRAGDTPAQEEIFGRVLVVISSRTEEETMSRAMAAKTVFMALKNFLNSSRCN